MASQTTSGLIPPTTVLAALQSLAMPFGHGLTEGVVMLRSPIFAYLVLMSPLVGFSQESVVLLSDDFSSYRPGLFSSVVGAHTEYHYLPEAAAKGNWAVSTFRSSIDSQRAWRIVESGNEPAMAQTYRNSFKHYHPMIVAGDSVWRDYTCSVRFFPQSAVGQCGVVFRYRNDRCYYFAGVDGQSFVLKLVRHATAFRKPLERILDQRSFTWEPGQELDIRITVAGESLEVESGRIQLKARDDTYAAGGIGLTADVPAIFKSVRVVSSSSEEKRIAEAIAARERQEAALKADNPKAVVWSRANTRDFGVGRNVRFGDLNGDGQIDALIGQVRHHGPKDRNSEVSCLTAMTFEGEVIWQIGEPDAWKNHLTNDVGFQVHDLDGDGDNEVVYCMNSEIVVAEGATGKTEYKGPTPQTPPNTPAPYNKFPRILGDALYFCDLRGTGHDSDIIIKDRYKTIWALDERLRIIWFGQCVTGHYPFAYDVDGDGKDELMMGYTLFNSDGTKRWSLDDQIEDHADGVAIVQFRKEMPPRLLCAASDEGIFFTDLEGNVLKHLYLGHVQNPAVADFRPDLPGLESVTINFWGNQGIVHFYDADGEIYHDFEPCQHGSMCLPINWTGEPGEYWVLSPNVRDGGMFDGWGHRVVTFPADGHPDMCNAVLDITGDCRDEVVVWDASEMWVYTQSDNPKQGRLYSPRRNALYNQSNYQATVSLPGWSE